MTARLAWRRSARSSATNCCVEVADHAGVVLVRDSKNPGPRLTFTPDSWTAFVAGVKAGELVRP